jgi:hypothetical protein
MTIPDWHVVPSEDGKDWSYQSDPYPFHDNPAFVEKIDNEFITVGEGGILVMEGHTYSPVTGEMKQKFVPEKDPATGEIKESDTPILSMSQYIEIAMQRKAKILNELGLPADGKLPEEYRTASESRANKLLNVKRRDKEFQSKFTDTGYMIWSDNGMYRWNDVTGMYDEDGDLLTEFYAYMEVELNYLAEDTPNNYGYVVMEGEGDSVDGFVIDRSGIAHHEKSTDNRPKDTGSLFVIDN